MALLCAAWPSAALVPMQTALAADTPLRVGKSVGTAFAQEPLDIGVQFGLFKQQGLDVTLTSFGGGGSFTQAMTGGSIDIGITASPELSLIVKGAPFKGVAVVGIAPYDLVIIVRKDGDIRTVDDLQRAESWRSRELSIR